MKVIKVFISQPTNGRSFEEVMDERKRMIDEFKELATGAKLIDEDTTIVDVNMSFADSEEGKGRIWYLGRSLQTMEEADFVIFHKDALKAAGCSVENAAAIRYFANCVGTTMASPTIWCDGSSAFGRLTPLIDEIYFNRIY